MRSIALLLVALGFAAYTAPRARAQSLYGPGGLFLQPSATVPPQGQLTLGALALSQHEPVTPGLHSTPTWASLSLDYGLTADIEVAATNLMITDAEPSWGGSLKYRFLHENRRQPAMAFGFTFLGFGGNDTQGAFVAVRKQLNTDEHHAIVGHFGVQYLHVEAGATYNEPLPYAGVELGLTPRLTFITEARPRGHGDIKAATALSLSYGFGRGHRLVVTYANAGQSTQPRFGVGVGYTLGGRR